MGIKFKIRKVTRVVTDSEGRSLNIVPLSKIMAQGLPRLIPGHGGHWLGS